MSAEPEMTVPLDADAQAVVDASYRIGALSKADEHHSYSSMLVACMLANNTASRWFRGRLAELSVEPAAQKQKLGLSEPRLVEIVAGTSKEPVPTKSLVWTTSAKQWLEKAGDFAGRRADTNPPTVSPCDLVAAFVFARSFHASDREAMGLGPANEAASDRGLLLANGFLSFILVRHSNDYRRWATIFRKELQTDPQPDVLAGPATRLASDSWTTDDRLGYMGYARAIRHFILHPSTRPPLSISIQAPWGAGKTSLMRMIQMELDPEATQAAKAGGWHAVRGRSAPNGSASLRTFLNILQGGKAASAPKVVPAPQARVPEEGRAQFEGDKPKRFTVWFNAWKYESGDQLWAGLATAIIDQLSARMRPVDREIFLLRLQASRIDPAKVRRQIHEFALAQTLTALRHVWIWVRAAIPLAFGAAAESKVPGAAVSGSALSVLWAGGEIAMTFGAKQKEAEEQPVSATLGDLASVPDYDKELGFTHEVVDDLQRIFEALPTAEQPEPIVVFVDDLDRCSPGKVASVMEGINMFLAGDFMPCVFIIGMDPQMVSAALDAAHEEIAARLPRYDSKTPLGWRFMDKFVQLPFTIPPPDDARVKEYTEHLLHGAEVDAIVAEGEKVIEQHNLESAFEPEAEAIRVAKEVASRRQAAEPVAAAAARVLRNSFALRLQDQMSEKFADTEPIVQEMLGEAIGSFSNNPRDIKRLLNIVRFQYLIGRARVADCQAIPDADILGRWIALSLRWPAFVRWLQWSPPGSGANQKLASSDMVKDRLIALEGLASSSKSFEAWQADLRKKLGFREGDVPWDTDPGLRDFLGEGRSKPLSDGAGLGFY